MLPSSPSSVMKAKIQQAQDARRQRLRTRLEEMAATGNPVHLAAPAFRRSDAGGPLSVLLLLCCCFFCSCMLPYNPLHFSVYRPRHHQPRSGALHLLLTAPEQRVHRPKRRRFGHGKAVVLTDVPSCNAWQARTSTLPSRGLRGKDEPPLEAGTQVRDPSTSTLMNPSSMLRRVRKTHRRFQSLRRTLESLLLLLLRRGQGSAWK